MSLTWTEAKEPHSNEPWKAESSTATRYFLVEWLPLDDREVNPWEWSVCEDNPFPKVVAMDRCPSLEEGKRLCEGLS